MLRPIGNFFAFGAVLWVSACGACRIPADERIPLENFFKEPEKNCFRISPDGERYAWLAPLEGRRALLVAGVGAEGPSGPAIVFRGEIDTYVWVDSQTILCQDIDADNRACVSRIDVAAGESRHLEYEAYDGLRLALDGPRINGELIVHARERGRPEWGLCRMNLGNGDIKPVPEGLDDVRERIFDHNGNYRIATREEGTSTHVLYRDNEAEPFRKLFSFDNVNDLFRPLFFDAENKNIYAYSNLGRDKVAFVVYDPFGKRESDLLYEHPEYDLFGDDETDFVRYSEARRRLAYLFFTTWKRSYHFFDDYYRSLLSDLQDRFPGYVIRIVSSDLSEKRHILRISSDRLRGRYYLFDGAGGSLFPLGDPCPWLDEKRMAAKEPIRYQSRDGLTIHGYLTLPRGLEPKNLPLVVYPHGGPQWRDCWEMGRFTEIQFLADRGYAVLQVNFRGSTGYGKLFKTAGFKQNGLNVQNDITDGIRYLIDRDMVDPGRAAILGGSYGGYAVLAGLAFTPDLYACGVDLFGVSSFFSFFDTMPPWFNKEGLYRTIGHPERDRDLLERTSPLSHADRIRAPLLIAQGGRDATISRRESDQMVDALKKRGVRVEYILKEDEGHGYFADERNRLELWRAIEVFLAEFLGGRNSGGGKGSG